MFIEGSYLLLPFKHNSKENCPIFHLEPFAPKKLLSLRELQTALGLFAISPNFSVIWPLDILYLHLFKVPYLNHLKCFYNHHYLTTASFSPQRLEWYSKEEDVRMCLLKGKSATQCQNYIRIMATMKNGKFFVCGTNSFKPMCRHYLFDVSILFVAFSGPRSSSVRESKTYGCDLKFKYSNFFRKFGWFAVERYFVWWCKEWLY